jgi:DNA-binding transcriptional ArsR family regulator
MPKYDERLNAVFKALGDPGRRAMLGRLSRGEATLGQLAEPLSMSLPAVHQHLAVLEAAGLVTCEKRGRERWCRLNPETLSKAEDWIAQRRLFWHQRLHALDRHLAEDAIADSKDVPTPTIRRRTR